MQITHTQKGKQKLNTNKKPRYKQNKGEKKLSVLRNGPRKMRRRESKPEFRPDVASQVQREMVGRDQQPPPPHQGDTLGRLQRDGLPCPHRARAQTDPPLKAQGPLDRLTLVTFLPPWDSHFPSWKGQRVPPSPSEAGFSLSPATGGQALRRPSSYSGTVPHLQDRLSRLSLQTQTRVQARRQQGPRS